MFLTEACTDSLFVVSSKLLSSGANLCSLQCPPPPQPSPTRQVITSLRPPGRGGKTDQATRAVTRSRGDAAQQRRRRDIFPAPKRRVLGVRGHAHRNRHAQGRARHQQVSRLGPHLMKEDKTGRLRKILLAGNLTGSRAFFFVTGLQVSSFLDRT